MYVYHSGFISKTHTVQRGIRQGCPFTALIFVVAVEILSIMIRNETGIKGFEMKIEDMIIL